MPAAGIRRTSRVFGVVHSGDGDRVLRSGRRLWPDNRLSNKSDEDECFKSVDETPRVLPLPAVEQDENLGDDEFFDDPISRESDAEYGVSEKRFGVVYRRKRKRLHLQVGNDSVGISDRTYGIHYVRRRKKERFASYLFGLENNDNQPGVLFLTFKGLRRNLHLFGTCFSCILSYMWNTSVGLRDLIDFLSSQPIATITDTAGISFSLEPCTDESKSCKIYYSTGMTLLFCVNFSSLPQCFMYMHLTMLLDSARSLLHLSADPNSTCRTAGLLEEIRYNHLLQSSVLEASVTKIMSTFEGPLSSLDNTSVQRKVMHSKTLPRSTFRTFRKKRTSRRSKRTQNHSSFLWQKSIRGTSISEYFAVCNRAARQFMFANQFHRKPSCSNIGLNMKETNLTKSRSRETADLVSCSANLLVIEADKCYREEGAHILLEQSPSKEWFLVVMRNGHTRCCHKADKIMRPYSVNQFTHGIMWTVADSLKLEFPNKSDWEVFKELYKNCVERNGAASTAKFIPVPHFTEVSSYGAEHGVPFSRPEAYIRQIGDEVSRALTRRSPNYDMDSEDEEWLNKFNTVPCRENSTSGHVTNEIFELIIDSLEKASYFMTIDIESGEIPANLCSDLCSRELMEAVHSYWINKRKKKQAVLVKVFQVHQQVEDPDYQDNFQRKKKQSKRSAGYSTKAKQQRTEAAPRMGITIKEDVLVKADTADALSRQYVDMAIKRRSIAQKLMVNADLMMYKAKMSLKIAEEAQNNASSELAVSNDSLNENPNPSNP